MPIPDPEAAVIAYLKDTPSVSSWVDGRIYGYELDVDADETWLPCIVVSAAGGVSPDWYIPLSRRRFDILCYAQPEPYKDDPSRSYGAIQAIDIDLAVYEALKYLDRAVAMDTLIMSALHEGGPHDMRDRDGRWPVRVNTWSFEIAEVYQTASS